VEEALRQEALKLMDKSQVFSDLDAKQKIRLMDAMDRVEYERDEVRPWCPVAVPMQSRLRPSWLNLTDICESSEARSKVSRCKKIDRVHMVVGGQTATGIVH
jgi:hypothetical protein